MVLATLTSHVYDAYLITDRGEIFERFCTTDFIEVGENYEWSIKKIFIPILTNGMYSGTNDDQV